MPVEASLKVLLVDEDSERSRLLCDALKKEGFDLVDRVQPGPNLLAKVSQLMPDMIVIDTASPDRDILESMFLLNEHNPLPVVMFADEDNETIIHEAIRSGVSGYIAKDVDMTRVKSILNVAIARFKAHQSVKNELKEVKGELKNKHLIDKAKRLLMKQKGASEQEAHDAMMKMSMQRNQKLVEVAQNIISVLEI